MWATLQHPVETPPLQPPAAAQVLGSGMYGKACVQFLEVEGAQKARAAIAGRLFAGNTVSVEHMQPESFQALYQSGRG